MKILMNDNDITRSIKRITYEILERNNGVEDLIIIGIKNGGINIAKKIGENIKLIEGVDVPVYTLDITNYRDDIKDKSDISCNNNIPLIDKCTILVDDVLFTGRSIRASMDAIVDLGRPKKIQLAVLVDRGHREFPIRADFVGKNIPTSKSEIVNVVIDENNLYVELSK